MSEWNSYQVPRRRGLILNGILLIGISITVGLMVTVASENPAGLQSVLLLATSLILAAIFPVLAYRLYALIQSEYSIGREGIRLRWGMRQLRLPHEMIVDNVLGDDLAERPQLPQWRWPGNLVGKIDDEELGLIEYLASDPEKLVFIGTLDRVYAISPENPNEFLTSLRNEAERGELEKGRIISVEPSFVLSEAWAEKNVRIILITGAALALALLIGVGIFIQGRDVISLGFTALGQADVPVISTQLYLLPAINIVIYMGNLLLGLVLFREKNMGLLAKLIWATSLLTNALFFAAVIFIVRLS